MFVFCLFLTSVLSWRCKRIEKQGCLFCRYPLLSPFVCRCALKLYVGLRAATLPFSPASCMPKWIFLGGKPALMVCISCFWAVFLLQSASGMLPAGMPKQKEPHLSKQGCFAPGWPCCLFHGGVCRLHCVGQGVKGILLTHLHR